ncbi:MAG: glycosyltransferase [Micavibrio sp.]|nr:glycosyltransferase [Micavibrio sp.]
MATSARNFKNHSTLHKDRVTIVMVAHEDYSSFPKAIDKFYENTDYPFDLLVVEGQAPHAIQTALEKRAKLYKNMRILYTHHTPLLNEAYNVAIAHARSPLVFFTDNRLVPEKGWLSDLVRALKLYNCDVLAPLVTDTDGQTIAAMTGQSFLATKQALTVLGIRR